MALTAAVFVTSCTKPASSLVPRAAAAASSGWYDPLADTTVLDVNSVAPNFTEVDVVTGQTISLQQFAGKVVLLNFVNYGCSSQLNDVVNAQLLSIKKLSQLRSDFVPFSVFCGCCSPEVLRKFAKDNGFNWPWILDSSNAILAQYNKPFSQWGYPTLIFIDQQGKISDITGAADLTTMGQKLDKITVKTVTTP